MGKYINPYTDFGFKKLFEQAEIARFTPEEVMEYEESVKIYRDLKNSMNTSFNKGKAEGKEEERLATAKKMKDLGLPMEIIAQVTGFTIDDIKGL